MFPVALIWYIFFPGHIATRGADLTQIRILTCIHQAFFIHAIYYYVILNFNRLDVVDIAVW